MASKILSQNNDIEKNWNDTNIKTLIDWTTYSAFNIEALDATIKYFQWIIKWNTILALILSSSAGTISTARFGLDANSYINTIFNYLFTVMSFTMTISTGCIKIFQIQEIVERLIKLKQEWIEFSLTIAAEFQLPLIERQDALVLITKYKSKYLDLLKTDNEMPEFIKKRVVEKLNSVTNNEMVGVYSLSNVICEINNGVKKGKNENDKNILINDINSLDLEYGFDDKRISYLHLSKCNKNELEALKSELLIKQKQFDKDKVNIKKEISHLIKNNNLESLDNIDDLSYNELITYKMFILHKINDEEYSDKIPEEN